MYRRVIMVCVATAALAAYAAEYELKWDTGEWGMTVVSSKGRDLWYANDFDVSTLKAEWRVKAMRVYCDRRWPNGVWDGYRVALFDLIGGVPGTIIWPSGGKPKYVKPNISGEAGWCRFGVEWALPASKKTFLAAMEQYYDPPKCDGLCSDNEMYNKGHTWRHYKTWERYYWHNFMMRVVVGEASAVLPASLGRVKALYR